jgi:hypothetical protein
LVGRVPISRRPQRQNLPYLLPRFGKKINELIRLPAQVPNADAARQ